MSKRKGGGKAGPSVTKAQRVAANLALASKEKKAKDAPTEGLHNDNSSHPASEMKISDPSSQKKDEYQALTSPKTSQNIRQKDATAQISSKTFGKMFSVFVTAMGLAAAVVTFWPRLTVSPSGLYDEQNPYSEIFTVLNTGFLPLYDVTIAIGFCSFETEKRNDLTFSNNNCDGGLPHIRLSTPWWETKQFLRDEPFSVTLTDALNVATDTYKSTHPNVIMGFKLLSRLKRADAIVIVAYRPMLYPWLVQSAFRFLAEEQPNGKLLWKSIPLSWQATNVIHD